MAITTQAQIEDCDCDWNLDDEPVCVTASSGFTFPLPNECFANCLGLEIVEDDCEIDWEDDEWDNDWNQDECECDEADWESEGLCIEVTGICEKDGVSDTLTYVTWVPSECYAECWGFEDYTVVECGDEYDGENGENGWDECECDEAAWETEGVCISVTEEYDGETLEFETWVPSECYAECWGFESYTVVDCLEGGDDWEDDDWNQDECECDEAAWETEGICISVSEDLNGETIEFETWVPSECYADCWGFENYSVVECTDVWDGEDIWEDCDCEYSEDDEPVCVLTNVETGEICPFPNMCFANCAGYTIDDVVDCDELESFCFECLEEEVDPVCVELDGETFPVPNACFADCLGLEIVEGDCGEFNVSNEEEIDLSAFIEDADKTYQASNNSASNVTGYMMYPNPASNQLNYELLLKENVDAASVQVIDLKGNLVRLLNQDLAKGPNTISIDVQNLSSGIYMINVMGQERLISQRFIKE